MEKPKPCCETCANWNEPKEKTMRYGICSVSKMSTSRDDICVRGWKAKKEPMVVQATDKKCECGKQITGMYSFAHPETGKTICAYCAMKVPAEMWKTEITRKCLDDLRLCRMHRASENFPADRDFTNMECGSAYACSAKCPVPHMQKITVDEKSAKPKSKTLDDTVQVDKKKQKQFPTEDVESFIRLQMRVLDKLSWHPHLWKLLDKLSSLEIEERLSGKSGLEAVPKMVGGQMQFQASDKTKKMFADLEKQFEDEDAKTGKKPYNIPTTRVEQFGWTDELKWTDEPEEKERDIECPSCHHAQSSNLAKCEVCGHQIKEEKKVGKKHKE